VVKTTRETLEEHCRHIVLESLPKTVRDAVHVCQRLKLRYLWVDALCIVQDDRESFQQEAAQMGDIYSGSHLTIAAHVPTSCKEGFLGDQDYGQPSWERKVWAESTAANGTLGSKYQVYIRIGTPPDEEDVRASRSSLNGRAWTLQEAILPHRILHYTGAELFWECGKLLFCECGHINRTSALHPYATIKGDLKRNILGDDMSKDAWERLVQDYTHRGITNVSDKLVAISGLAQLISATSPAR
jgi:hypothetical protein